MLSHSSIPFPPSFLFFSSVEGTDKAASFRVWCRACEPDACKRDGPQPRCSNVLRRRRLLLRGVRVFGSCSVVVDRGCRLLVEAVALVCLLRCCVRVPDALRRYWTRPRWGRMPGLPSSTTSGLVNTDLCILFWCFRRARTPLAPSFLHSRSLPFVYFRLVPIGCVRMVFVEVGRLGFSPFVLPRFILVRGSLEIQSV